MAFQDPQYREAVVDLLGGDRVRRDLGLRAARGGRQAGADAGGQGRDRVDGLRRVRPRRAAARAARRARRRPVRRRWRRSAAPIDQFHEYTAPADWFEGLIKAYVGDGMANDFYREIAAYLDADTRDLIVASLEDSGHSAFVVDRVRAAIAADPRLGGRLALWGRRLMGEALTQAQRVAADRDALTALLAGGVDRPGLDLAALGRMFTRITERHAERMAELGLAS